MIKKVSQLYYLLAPVERRRALFCLMAMLMMAMVDVMGVASIMPFMAVIADPQAVAHHAKLAFLYNKLHFSHDYQFMIFLGLVVFSMLLLSNAVSMFTTWMMLNFTYSCQYTLSLRLFRHYLDQPYIFFLNRHGAELSKNILNEVIIVINRAFIPCMQLIAKAIVTTFMLLLLLVVDPILALVVCLVSGGAYLILYVKVRKHLNKISQRSLLDNQKKHKIVTEAFNSIKDIKLLGNEFYFIRSFSHFAKQHAEDEAAGNIIAHLPRYVLETIAFGGVLLIIIYLLVVQHNIRNAMPLLALYAFASFRLMPAMQQIFTSVAFMKMSKEAVNMLTRDLQDRRYAERVQQKYYAAAHILPFHSQISMHEVSFSYPNCAKPVITALNLKIPFNTTIGFVGMTGTGKTTLIDLLLGLLPPQQGEIKVDGVPVTAQNLASWQKKIGYVPQHIYLSDDTITRNIAFGVADADIDFNAVKKAASMANIHKFIETLNQGFETTVGDRGVRLSGGQRQRIGIARALYHQPQIIVLDEATSSLDTLTEEAVFDAIHSLIGKKTIIIIAHRLSTLIACDMIHVLKDGMIVSSGTYHSLLSSCQQFKQLAQGSIR